MILINLLQIPDDLKRKILLRLRFGDNSEADVLVPANNESQNVSILVQNLIIPFFNFPNLRETFSKAFFFRFSIS